MTRHSPTSRHARRAVALGLLVLASGCTLTGDGAPPDTGFRQARFEQMQSLQKFEQCRDEGLQLDLEARSRGAAPAFLTSASVLSKCLSELGTATEAVPADERMRLQALGVVNFFKGGDVEAARREFDAFRTAWPDHDLYLSGGTSFVATAETLLGRSETQTFGRFMALNVTDEVKSEMRRMNHWKNK